jgi:arginyl-tRNA synthetase
MEGELKKAIQAALNELGTQHRIDAYAISFVVEATDLEHGDYATNVALVGAKPFGTNPQYLAGDLLPRIKSKLDGIASNVEIAGPGFINITLAPTKIREMLSFAQGSGWGMGTENADKRIVVEYSCPNPFKEMHIGHLMSTIIGESISRLIGATGATVIRDSYGGDIGPHVAKAIWELQRKGVTQPSTAQEIGDAYAHGSRAYEESEDAKKEIDVLNTRLYEVAAKQETPNELSSEDRELLNLWRLGREVALESFREIYRVLETHFDYFLFESETTPVGMRVVQDELARGVFEESEGAIIYKGEKKGLHTLVFITSRGTPTYEAKDVGLAFLKEEKIPNNASYILTGAEQVGHFKVFLGALEDIAPLVAAKTKHISHGLLQLPTGKMSSRKGNVITATDVLTEMIAKASERNEDPIVAEQVAIGALKYLILRASPGTNIIFDIEKSLSLEGDSGPYLQYAVVRAKSILAQAGEKIGTLDAAMADAPEGLFEIERYLMRFPEVVARAAKDQSPNQLVQYLTQLASEWNAFYANERILGGEHETYKLFLAQAFVQTMTNGLSFLGIASPERM